MFNNLDWITNDASPCAMESKEALFRVLMSYYEDLGKDADYLQDLIDEGAASTFDMGQFDSICYQLSVLQSFFTVLGFQGGEKQ